MMDLASIRRFVLERAHWIERKLADQCRRPPDVSRLPDSGARLPFLGQSLSLEIVPGRAAVRHHEDGRLLVPAQSREQALRKLKQWYRKEALAYAQASVGAWAQQLGRAPSGFVIREQRTRWGSCSDRGVVSLNWRLLLGPPELFEYVLVHELCHLYHRNHGPRFWAEVEQMLPDYMSRRLLLRGFEGTWF